MRDSKGSRAWPIAITTWALALIGAVVLCSCSEPKPDAHPTIGRTSPATSPQAVSPRATPEAPEGEPNTPVEPPPPEEPPPPPPPPLDVRPERQPHFALGGVHSCFLNSDGVVSCWGSNRFGQLADPGLGAGPFKKRMAAHHTPPLDDARQLVSGTWHVCALLGSGRVMCWGHNAAGQLGDGSEEDRDAPTLVTGLDDVVELSAGEMHTCARRADRSVWCWGRSDFGQCGEVSDAVTTPVRVGEIYADSLGAGRYHSCSVFEGVVSCWGSNIDGTLGDGTTGPPPGFRPEPQAIRLPGLVAEVEGGGTHTCARMTTGEVLCWGGFDSGQLGDGRGNAPEQAATTPVRFGAVDDAVEIALGSRHTCVRRETGNVVCAGLNAFGQLGDETNQGRFTPVPVQDLRNAVSIETGSRHTCAIRSSRQLMCWGRNKRWQLGDGTDERRLLPTRVSRLTVRRAPTEALP